MYLAVKTDSAFKHVFKLDAPTACLVWPLNITKQTAQDKLLLTQDTQFYFQETAQ